MLLLLTVPARWAVLDSTGGKDVRRVVVTGMRRNQPGGGGLEADLVNLIGRGGVWNRTGHIF